MEPVSSLAPSGLPSAEGIPNNHLFYAFQWFFFAAAATVIYALALMRRGGAKVVPPDHSSSVRPHMMQPRSEEHTSELPSLMRISYAVICLKKQKIYNN